MNHLNDEINWAVESKTAIPAFNIFSIDFMAYTAEFSNINDCPVIVQTSKKTVDYYGVSTVVDMFNAVKAHYNARIFLHLDHCSNIPLINECIKAGYDSVMADFSSYAIEENIREFGTIALKAREIGCLVEGEVGELGKEDGEGSSAINHTKIENAIKFTSNVNIDLFAPVFGNAHGNYKQDNPFLNFDLFENIASKIDVPLVLHGASGLSFIQIKKCIMLGVVKINYSTVFKNVFSKLIIKSNDSSLESMDPLSFNKEFKENIFKEFKMIYDILNTN